MKAAFYKATRPGAAGVYNRVVRAVDGGPYSHGELVLSDGTCWSASYMDGGVRAKTISFDPAKWDLLDLPGEWNEASARAFCEASKGQAYSLLGNLKFLPALRWVPVGKGTFCTMFMAAACNAACPALGWTKPWWFGPRKLHEALSKLGTQ